MFEVHHRLRTYCEHSHTFRGITDRSVKTINHEVGAFLAQTGIERVEDISRPKIEVYMLNGRTESNWSAKTIRNRLITLRGFLKWCVDQNFIQENPAQSIPLPKIRKKLPEHLPKADAFELLNWTKSYRYLSKIEGLRAIAIIATFIYAGLRHSELYNLNKTDVNMDNRTIFVRSGKGDRDRYVPICDDLAIYLAQYITAQTKRQSHCPAFFVSLNNDKRMSVSVIPRLVKKLRNASGIYFYPHMLRHTFATLLLEGGASIVSIKEMMGHSDVTTTMIYISVTPQHLRSEIAKHSLNTTTAPIPQSYF